MKRMNTGSDWEWADLFMHNCIKCILKIQASSTYLWDAESNIPRRFGAGHRLIRDSIL